MLLFGDVDDVDVGVWTMDVIPDLKQNHSHVSADIMCVLCLFVYQASTSQSSRGYSNLELNWYDLESRLLSSTKYEDPRHRPEYLLSHDVPRGHAEQAGPGAYIFSPTLLPPGP